MNACVNVGMSISVHESESVSITHTLQHFCRVFPSEAPRGPLQASLQCFPGMFLQDAEMIAHISLSVIVSLSVSIAMSISLRLSECHCS